MRITVLNENLKPQEKNPVACFLLYDLFLFIIVELVNIFDMSFHFYPVDV